MADAPPANPNEIDELAVDFTRDTMPIAANNLTRRQLFQILPRSMSQYELAFVRNAIREADRDTKMDPVFERNKVFGLQLNGQPYPEAAAAPAQAPAPTFTLAAGGIVQHRAVATSASNRNLKAHPTPKLRKLTWEEGSSAVWSTPRPAVCMKFPMNPMRRSSWDISEPH
jgi:hypothetical protein